MNSYVNNINMLFLARLDGIDNTNSYCSVFIIRYHH